MNLKVIACEVLARSLYLSAARSPHIIDLHLFKKALHEKPANLRATLQEAIDAADNEGYDAILLAYGLCGKATAGLQARSTPLVIPRAHDCITLFLGSRSRYQEQFTQNPGTYWYVQDYIEREGEGGTALSLGSGTDIDINTVYQEYVEKYGKDNADYLMEVMGAWQAHYNRAAYIDMGIADGKQVEERAQAEAARRGWTFDRLAGDINLIQRLLSGDWEADFLVLQPGQKIAMAADEGVVCGLTGEEEAL